MRSTRTPWTGWAAWLLALLGAVGMGLSTVLEFSHAGPRDMGGPELVLTCVGVGVCAVLGLRILQRDWHQGMGWLLVAMAAVGGLLTLAEVYAFDALVRHGGPTWGAIDADAVSQGSWLVAYGALSVVALLFPTGRLSGPGWRPLAWGCALAFPAGAALVSIQPGRQDDPFDHLANPAGVRWIGTGPGQVLTGVVMMAALGCMAGCVASLLDRFVRAEGVERQQIKALLYAASLTPVAFLACLVSSNDQLASLLLPLALAVVPLAVGLAVLRYRLYDVDRLINRTLVYLTLTMVLSACYVAVSWAVGKLAPESRLATAVATAAAVLAFRPLRDMAQQQIDVRFARSSARARVLLRAYTDDLRHGRRAAEELRDVLALCLEDDDLQLRFRLDQPGWHVDETGFRQHAVAAGWTTLGGSAAEVRSAKARPGLLLSTVVRESGLALQVAYLHAEVRAQTALVAEAKIRIAAAGYEERRRLERDLHDGAQQRLLALGLQLRRVQRSLPEQAQVLRPALDQAVDGIGDAIADLRRLANGAAPLSLESGLASALAELAEGLPVPLTLNLPASRLPERVEAAAYFVACEAVTNAVKHASASRINLTADVVDGALHVVVTDDGRGGAAPSGSGLTGLADRVAAHGGRLEVRSPPGRGTTLEVVIPCGS